MNITIRQGGIQEVEADAIIVNLFEGVDKPGGATGVVDKALDGAITDLIEGGDLRGKLGQTAVFYPRGAIPARRVIIVGLGKQAEFDLEGVREAAAKAVLQAKQVGAAHVASIVHGGGIGDLDLAEAAQAVVEGSMLAMYEYDAPRSKKEDEEETDPVETLTLVEFDESKIGQIEAGARIGKEIAESVYLARTLVNQPSNVASPTGMVETARQMCAEVGLACRTLDEATMEEEEMGLLLSVSQGSTEPAYLLIMEHKPDEAQAGPIVLVGKGVVFDTGGYNLKPSSSIGDMKGDMAGAAAVIGAMRAIARLKLPLHVIGLTPLVDNMVSATAYKPGDVFIGKNGVSVEISNTDAEGRLILADTLCYADSFEPVAVIDIATLTGGKLFALGERMNAIFCENEQLAQALQEAGEKVGEPLWPLPLDSAYDRQLKSQVADIQNSGGRAGSLILGGRFLAHFVADWPWAHLDIAGSEFYSNSPAQTPRSYLTKGATAIPTRTLVELLRNWTQINADKR